jgi:cyclophilin family peptidyl-prolyl cis-trans isomerase
MRVRIMRIAAAFLVLLAAPLTVNAQEAFAVAASPRVRVVTTVGDFVIELDRSRAPLTVEAFLQHVTAGFYAGTVFHRVVAGFIAQAGGYTADLTLKTVEGTVFNESGNGLSNLRGTIGLARSGEPHSGTSQFYINLADNLDLNPRPTRWGYAVFGKIVEGMEIADEIGHVPTSAGGEFDRNVPVTPISIERMVLLPN